MLFIDFLKKLAYGQLKNTSVIFDQDLGTIDSDHENQLLELTNQGLIDITTKMKLLESTFVLPFISNQNIYTLTESFDSAFTDYVRLLSVHGVYKDLDTIPENEKTFIPKSNSQITMPSWSSVRFTDKFMEDYAPEVDLKFQIKHPKIELNGTINLPPHLHEALALYVSGLYLSHMGSQEHTAKGDSYYGLYLKMIGDDVDENKSQTSEVLDEDIRFQDRGFV